MSRKVSFAYRIPLVLLLPLALAGCVGVPRDSTPGSAATAPSGTLEGQILIPRGMAAPESGSLQLQLLPRFGGGRTLAGARLPIEAAPPWRFALPFDRAEVADPTLFRLDVALFDGAGHLRYISDGEHPVNLDPEAEPTRIELIPIDASAPGIGELDCAGRIVTLQFSEPDLLLSLDAVPHRLRRAHSALGRRYVGADAELWLQADEARLQLAERLLTCRPIDSR